MSIRWHLKWQLLLPRTCWSHTWRDQSSALNSGLILELTHALARLRPCVHRVNCKCQLIVHLLAVLGGNRKCGCVLVLSLLSTDRSAECVPSIASALNRTGRGLRLKRRLDLHQPAVNCKCQLIVHLLAVLGGNRNCGCVLVLSLLSTDRSAGCVSSIASALTRAGRGLRLKRRLDLRQPAVNCKCQLILHLKWQLLLPRTCWPHTRSGQSSAINSGLHT